MQSLRGPAEARDIEVQLAGERLLLTAARAIVWTALRTLIVADLHIGKAASFRALGTPLPHGTTADTLERLAGAIRRYDIGHAIVLGDFLHSDISLPPATLAQLRLWRERHPDIQLTLVSGNHDRHAGKPPSDLRIETLDRCRLGPYVLAHHPRPASEGYVLAGHLHPVMRIANRVDSIRVPCYWVQPQVAVLPAFGAFTGGWEITPAPADGVYLIADDRVLALPRRPAPTERIR